MAMKKWVVALIVVVAVLVLAFIGVATWGYFRFYKPLLSANTYVGGAQRLETIIANKSAYDPPGSGELTADQVARFVAVEERVQARIGDRRLAFTTQYDVLRQIGGGPTSRVVRRGLGEIGGVYLQAKEAQYRALNETGFSKAEYEWVRRQVYTAAGLPVAQLDLPQILVDPGNLEKIIEIDRASIDGAAASRNRPLVERHLAKLNDWLALAFFDL